MTGPDRAEQHQERRRSPRVRVASRCEVHVQTHVRVRLLDISASGALLAPEEPLPVGATGRLRLPLAGVPFETQVEVRRADPGGGGRETIAGVVLKAMPPDQRDTLDEFLRRAGN
jgi:c-di-GMP-binding flagellar brake protein YcgR